MRLSIAGLGRRPQTTGASAIAARAARIVALASGIGLAGCASLPSPSSQPPAPPWEDAAFTPVALDTSARDLFALTPEMRHFLRSDLSVLLHMEGRQEGLYQALRSQRYLKLDYDAAHTRTAAEAFRDRAGNCLSLVILSATLARDLGLSVSFQEVLGEDSWGLSGDFIVASGHVNLVLGQRSGVMLGDESQARVVDFLPSDRARGYRTRRVGETTLVAMYQNNRAAEALVEGRLDEAYAWAQAAVRTEPQRTASLNTLGVVYQRRGLPAAAEQTWRLALALAPEDTRVMGNLVALLQAQDRPLEAQPLSARLASLQSLAPFTHYREGLLAARAGDWPRTRDEMQQEIARNPNFLEAQAWLAQAYLALGDLPEARRHLQRAAELGDTPADRSLYAAKLARLSKAPAP
ncbi:tetratricopeptide repeat protein [Ideonella oryzae]|nr:tetratricopeptide repeat protein [Ideonella oryzae]